MKKRNVKQLILTGILAAALASGAMAMGTESSSWSGNEKSNSGAPGVSLYDQGMQAHKSGDYKSALDYFQRALKKDKNNPDIINMIAHTERKLGRLNEAIEDYWKALKLRPNFPEAREYMGEAYIQAALNEIETLKSYGTEGEESLNDLTKDFKEAADTLQK